jgi:hypothetical protein
MNDENLDKSLNSIRDTYRVPPEPPIEAMWAAIDRQLASAPNRWTLSTRRTSWALIGLAAAASLVMGIGVGRWTASRPAAANADVACAGADATELTPVSDLAAPLERTASAYLGETIALLREVQTSPSGAYARRAASLLTTTRLLLDAPAGTSTRMQTLLEDLELIFAQLSLLPQEMPRADRELGLETIRAALTQREVVPRARTVVVSLASSED